ncbi:MAG: C-terminal binding protein [Phyllobacteriaceae bacterium]|jgi:D-3-phosphoglycerate dehydrogenase|nr:C-terminal binding protein [Phyllobacteriaceae bacterium]
MSQRVVVTDAIFPNLAQEEAAAHAAGADFEGFQCTTADDVAKAVKDADVAVVQFAPFAEAAAKAVKPGATVIRYGVGYDNIDVAAARAAGLKVGYVPDYCTDEVADHTVALALSLLRKLPALDASVRSGEWAAVKNSKPLKPFGETAFGFFGLGQIGTAVLHRLNGFGFRFIAADPGLADANKLGVRVVDADTLLAEADIITCHAPATDGTTGFFNATAFRRMKDTAFLVNTARGQLIAEDDLATALKDGAIAGAGLDVFVEEPLPESSPLREAPNLILTPHSAWYSEAAIDRLQGLVAQDITRALNGEAPRRPVP